MKWGRMKVWGEGGGGGWSLVPEVQIVGWKHVVLLCAALSVCIRLLGNERQHVIGCVNTYLLR